MMVRRCGQIIGVGVGLLGLFWFTLVGQAQSGRQLAVNHLEMVPDGDGLTLQLYFTVKDERGALIAEPDITGEGMVVVNGESFLAQVGVPDDTNPLFIALALDGSGSMEGSDVAMQNAAAEAVGNAPQGSQFALITFNEFVTLQQAFTADQGVVTQSIRSIPAPDGGTCLYDAIQEGITAVSAQVGSTPRARGAVIVFTDGRDERTAGVGDVCSSTQLSTILESTVPVYTIGLLGEKGVNASELEQIARDTRGLSAVGERDNLQQLFQTIMLGLSSQLVATSTFCVPEGEHNATFNIPFEDGAVASVTVPFESTLSCAVPVMEPVIQQADVVLLDDGQTYQVDLVADNIAAVAEWQVRIIDDSGNRVFLETFNALIGEPIQFSLADLAPETRYQISVSALDANGRLLQNGDDSTLAQNSITTPAIEVAPPKLAMEEFFIIRDEGVFQTQLQIENGDQIASYEGQLIVADTNERLRTFIPELDNNNVFTISLEALAAATYRIDLKALNEDSVTIAEASQEIDYAPQRIPFFIRLLNGFLERPYLPLLALLILLALIFYLVRRRHNNQPAWPTAAAQAAATAYTPPVHKTQLGERFDDIKVAPEPDPWMDEPFPETVPTPTAPMQTAKLQILATPGMASPATAVSIHKTPFLLGREGCNLNVERDRRVSRAHARIEQQDDVYLIQDLQSANGTFVNGQRLQMNEKKRLENGAEIRLGRQTRVQFRLE